MFELSDFYDYCRKNQIDVIPFNGIPHHPGATLRDGNCTAVFLDFSRIRDLRLLRGVCYHELGHAATGALHKIDSPYELVERSEYRANRWSAQQFLGPDAFRSAFADGCTELWQLAEYFDLPEADVLNALTYWRDRQGMDLTPKKRDA